MEQLSNQGSHSICIKARFELVCRLPIHPGSTSACSTLRQFQLDWRVPCGATSLAAGSSPDRVRRYPGNQSRTLRARRRTVGLEYPPGKKRSPSCIHSKKSAGNPHLDISWSVYGRNEFHSRMGYDNHKIKMSTSSYNRSGCPAGPEGCVMQIY